MRATTRLVCLQKPQRITHFEVSFFYFRMSGNESTVCCSRCIADRKLAAYFPAFRFAQPLVCTELDCPEKSCKLLLSKGRCMRERRDLGCAANAGDSNLFTCGAHGSPPIHRHRQAQRALPSTTASNCYSYSPLTFYHTASFFLAKSDHVAAMRKMFSSRSSFGSPPSRCAPHSSPRTSIVCVYVCVCM
jgi:hypothetical protein